MCFFMRIAICDDCCIDRELIVYQLQQYCMEKSIHYEIAQYKNGASLLCDMEDGCWFDVVFLDIYMKGMLGIHVAEQLRARTYNGAIVFFTSSSEFAVDSYDVEAAGYLLKPSSYEKLCRVMDRILHAFDASTYQVQQRSKVIRVPYHEILYVESSNSKCILHCREDGSLILYKRLDEIEEELNDPRFLRCHQSYLVNMDHIRQADRQFELTTGDIVLIRQRDLKTIRQRYLDYMAEKYPTSSGGI